MCCSSPGRDSWACTRGRLSSGPHCNNHMHVHIINISDDLQPSLVHTYNTLFLSLLQHHLHLSHLQTSTLLLKRKTTESFTHWHKVVPKQTGLFNPNPLNHLSTWWGLGQMKCKAMRSRGLHPNQYVKACGESSDGVHEDSPKSSVGSILHDKCSVWQRPWLTAVITLSHTSHYEMRFLSSL